MSKYPEWFIGGPLHGKNKSEYSHCPDWHVINADSIDAGPGIPTQVATWRYRRDTFRLGTVIVPFWTDKRMIAHEQIASLLGEIIMAPHALKEEAAS